jgi:peptidoglycan/LPS O-acetylase OafA/YrhL
MSQASMKGDARNFRHKDGNKQHLPALTGIRGWAAAWVLLYHAWVYSEPRLISLPIPGNWIDLTPFFSIGWAGVPIFFVLSGFLLGLPYAAWQAGHQERPDLLRYLRRRIARVFPAYYVQWAFLLVASALLSQAWIWSLWDVLRQALMLYFPPPWGAVPLNEVWWTLPIEFSFYLLLPVFAYVLRPNRWWWLLGSGLLIMWAWRYGVVTIMVDAPISDRIVPAYQLPGSLDMFGIGMLGAIFYVNRSIILIWPKNHEQADLLVLGGVMTCVSLLYWMHHQFQLYWANNLIFYLWTPLFAISVLMIIIGAMEGSRVAHILFANRLIVYTGMISYSVYLWHSPILRVLSHLMLDYGLQGYRLPWLLLFGCPVIAAVATLSYQFVERPFMPKRVGVIGQS